MACLQGHYDIVKYLIKKGIDITQVSSIEHTGLSVACAMNHTDIIELLTDKLNRVCIVCENVSRNTCLNCDTRYCSS
jgi:ankyrin repeat protein